MGICARNSLIFGRYQPIMCLLLIGFDWNWFIWWIYVLEYQDLATLMMIFDKIWAENRLYWSEIDRNRRICDIFDDMMSLNFIYLCTNMLGNRTKMVLIATLIGYDVQYFVIFKRIWAEINWIRLNFDKILRHHDRFLADMKGILITLSSKNMVATLFLHHQQAYSRYFFMNLKPKSNQTSGKAKIIAISGPILNQIE